MPIYSSFNTKNTRFTKSESKAAFARLKGVSMKSNSSYTYSANPDNYSGSSGNYSNSSQRSHYESWCYTDSQGTTYEPVC
jgi:hypothetical protein